MAAQQVDAQTGIPWEGDFHDTLTEISHRIYDPDWRRSLIFSTGQIIRERVEKNVHGYEKRTHFQSDIFMTHTLFSQALEQLAAPGGMKRLRIIRPNQAHEFEDLSQDAYSTNLRAWSYFLNDSELSVPRETATQNMYLFSLVIYLHDPDIWDKARKRSHMWPFCRTRL